MKLLDILRETHLPNMETLLDHAQQVRPQAKRHEMIFSYLRMKAEGQGGSILPWLAFSFPPVSAPPKADTRGAFVFAQSIAWKHIPRGSMTRDFLPRIDFFMSAKHIQIIDHAAKDALLTCKIHENKY